MGSSLSRLDGPAVLRDLKTAVAHERGCTAVVLEHIAEVEARRLYAPEGYPSMHDYCVRELNFTERSARKRIHAARTARDFPVIFEAVADGRLHLSGVVMLAPHLTPENVLELLGAAAHQTKAEIERLLARRFPRPDVPSRVVAIPGQAPDIQLADATTAANDASHADSCEPTEATLPAQRAPGRVEKPSRVKPRAARHGERARCIPAHVRRAVRERDGEQCTFVSESGKRCPAAARTQEKDLIPCLRRLGISPVEAREAAAQCEDIAEAPVEQRLRRARGYLYPKNASARHLAQ